MSEHARDRFASLIDLVQDGVVELGLDGSIIFWSDRAERITGLAAADAIGRSLPACLGDAPAVADLLARPTPGRSVELQLLRSGFPVTCEVHVRASDGHRLVLLRDITERQLAQDMLSATDTQLREAERQGRFGVWTWDASTDEVQWSEALYELTGVDPFDFGGSLTELVNLFADDDGQRLERELRTALRDGTGLRGHFRLRVDDDVMHVLVSADPERGSDGEPIGMRGIALDRSQDERALQVLRETAEREQQAARQVAEAASEKDEFLRVVSHDLKAPLTTINGFAKMLLSNRARLDDEQIDLMLDRISANADAMRDMAERLLEYARLTSGSIEMAPADVRVADVVDQVRTMLAGPLEQHPLTFEDSGASVVAVDRRALLHVLANLVGNAAKFSPDGVGVTVSTRVVADGDLVAISVTDRGDGIPSESLDKIFQRFYRGAGARAGGTGVGLSIVQKYVELMGGSIDVESTVGEGATFTVQLPASSAGRG